jgi:NACalpha-BTF3-like transcription factor
MNKIVLIGTSHDYQTGKQSDKAIEQFRRLLILISYEHKITTIAEEMRQSDIDREDKCKSIPCMVATELSIKHQYSDPERKEREKRGICLHPKDIELKKQTDNWTDEQIKKALRESDEKREKYWLAQLNDWRIQLRDKVN